MSEVRILPPTAAANRRTNDRRVVLRRVGVTIQDPVGGPNIAVGLANVSGEGLGVRLNAPVAEGHEVSLELFLPGVNKPVNLTAEVRWCGAVGDSTFEAGLRLHRSLTYGELTGLGG